MENNLNIGVITVTDKARQKYTIDAFTPRW